MTYTEKRVEEFRKVFPNKLGEVIDDFGSTVKSDIESFMTTKIAQAVAEAAVVGDWEAEIEKYKEPTELNGTVYYRLPVNKLTYLLAVKDMEIFEAYKQGFVDGGLSKLPDRPINSERE